MRNTRLRRALVAATVLTLPMVPTAMAGAAVEAGTFDGDPATTERINEGDPVYAAIEISARRFGADRSARHAVLSRVDVFADSVAGSALTAEGPMLFTEPGALRDATRAEIDRVLDPGDTVYLLGGTAALSSGVAAELADAGYVIGRLAGRTRIGTALRVADEVRRRYGGDQVLLARSDGWADSVTGGGVAADRNVPILITPTAALHPAVASWLAVDAPTSTTLLGGTAALSAAVQDAVPNPRRVSGIDRTATATAIASTLWTGAGERFVVTQGLADHSWAFGFAAAGLAADADAPILLVTREVTEATAAAVRSCGAPSIDLLVVGDGATVPAHLREQLDAADGLACGTGGRLVYPTGLKSVDTCSPLLAWFKEAALERVGPYGMSGGGVILPGVGGPEEDGADDGGGTPTASPDASGTNNQEEGVDEPDIVKVAGSYAYVVARNELQVVRVDGAPDVVATMALPEGGSSELLLNGSRLLVITRSWQYHVLEDGAAADAPIGPGGGGEVETTLRYVDVSVPTAPSTTSTLTLEGDYRSARLIGSVARVVLQHEPVLELTYPTDFTPEAEHEAFVANREAIESSTIADWLPAYSVDGGADRSLVDCGDVRQPPLFSGLGTLSVVSVDLAGTIEPTSAASVVASGETVYASADRLYVTTNRWGWEADALGSTVTTEVHAFDISSPTATTYVGSGSVDGYVLNQFALSEHDGALRIATTTEPPWSPDGEQLGVPESAVTVLAEQGGGLVRIGHLGGLGVDERIYGVRYFGEVAAVVTFRQVDPLYLIDLSDPTSPRVTGELKLPGFSSYLHRIDDTHLLGIGSDADAEGRVTGAAASLFDISDLSAPALVDRVTFADGYTSVGYDHHAFLFWPTTGLVVFPLEEYDPDGSGFQGAVGLDVSATGLDEVGRATHFDDADLDTGWPMISRSFVANGSLYTVSEGGIEQASVDTLTERAFASF